MGEVKSLLDNGLPMNFVSITLEENSSPNFIITYDQTFSNGYIFENITKGIPEIIFEEHNEQSFPFLSFKPRFLNLSRIDILGQIIFAMEGCPVHGRVFSRIPGLYS